MKKYLKNKNFKDISIVSGEFTNLKNEYSDDCCMDIYFVSPGNDFYMLTLFEDGLTLLKDKNKNNIELDVDYIELFRKEESHQILSSLRAVISLNSEFDFLECYLKGFYIIPEFETRENINSVQKTIFHKEDDDFARYTEDLKGNLLGLNFFASRDIITINNIKF